MRREDVLSKRILSILEQSEEPLETREIELLLEKETRVRILYRLNLLRGDGSIKGKAVGSGKGAWVWWSSLHFAENKKSINSKNYNKT